MGKFSINLIDALMSIGISRDRAYSQVELSLRTDINATRLAIADSKTEIIKWMIGSIVALGGLLIAVIRLSV
jgi:hypothetical protein